MEYIPYVYLIKNKTTNLKYLGVRYAKGCHPSDLWSKYFTSSSMVKRLIEEFGENDFYVKVIHTFPSDPESAILKEAHYFKYIKTRDDYLNITYSSGVQDLRIASKGGKVGGAIVYNKKIGIFRDNEERLKWAKMGGKASWESENNVAFKYWASKEGRSLRSSLGGKNGCFSIQATMRKYNCDEESAKDFLSIEQRERGTRGGIKNGGFRWYNDGIKDHKYTKADQNNKPFDVFLSENLKFKAGRV